MGRWMRALGLAWALVAGAPVQAAVEQCQETQESWSAGAKQTEKRAFEIFRSTLKPAKTVFDGVSGSGLDGCFMKLFDVGLAASYTGLEFDGLLLGLFRQVCAMASEWVDQKLNELLGGLQGAADGFRFRAGFLETIGGGRTLLRFSVSASVSRNPWQRYTR